MTINSSLQKLCLQRIDTFEQFSRISPKQYKSYLHLNMMMSRQYLYIFLLVYDLHNFWILSAACSRLYWESSEGCIQNYYRRSRYFQLRDIIQTFKLIRCYMTDKECVKVAVRCRPLSSNEIKKNFESIVDVIPERGEIIVHNKKDVGEKQRVFSFDLTFQPGCAQDKVFKQAALPIIESVLEGYNGTIFAYGQTGTGKTHTMEGIKTEQLQRGIIPRTFQHIINAINGTPGVQFLVKVSMLQLYNEQIVDLLSNGNDKLQIHEDKDKGIYVKDLSADIVSTVEEMNKKLKEGSGNRHVGSTDMNQKSSRSHCIFMIRVQQEQIINGQSKIKAGKLNLVDLAGSERQKKTQATGNRSKEGIYINLALSTLGQVIKALVSSNPAHIPYRDSKLTRLLQESLGGNAKTIMIANVGPAQYNYEETMSTLRYASEAKKIKNKPKINEDPKDAMIREFQAQIQRLKRILEGKLPMEGPVTVVEKKVKKEPKEISSRLQKQKEKIEQQKKNLLGQDLERKNELEKKKLEVDKKKQQEKLKQEELAIKLKQMKDKLLHGNKVKEEARLHQKKLFEAQKELEERKQQERRLEQELNKKNLDIQNFQEKNLGLKEQVQHRRKQLAKINNKLKAAYQANNDIQEFMVQEREQLEEQNRSIVRQLKLVNMIIEHFVPIHQLAAIQHRLEFDESFDDWVIVERNRNPKPNPGSALGFKYPLCSQGRFAIACGDDNPRFKQDNILQLDLDQIPPTIEDFKYEISQSVMENLSVVLNDNEEQQRIIAKEERPNVYIDDPQKMNKQQVMRQRESTTRAKSAKKMRPATGNKKKK